MTSTRKTKKELLQELEELRGRLSALDAAETGQGRSESIPHEIHQILESMFDRTRMIVIHLDLDFNFIRVSRAFAEAAGHDPSYFVGVNFFTLYPSSENETLFRRVLESNEVIFESAKAFILEEEVEIEARHFDWTMIPIKRPDNTVSGLLLMLRDITEETRREQEYSQLVNGMNDTAFVIDFNGKFLEINDTAVEVFGYSREELLEMGPNDIDASISPEGISQLIEGMKMGETQVFETRHIRKDGSTFPVEVSSSLVTYGGKKAILSVSRDLTDRKRIEQYLALTYAGIDHAQIGLFQVNDDGKIYYVNQYACDNLGYTHDEMLNMHIWDIDINMDEERWKKHRERTRSQVVTNIEAVHRRKDGTELPVEVTINFATIGDKQVSISVSKDITERKQAEQQREILLDQLREQAQRLLDVMSTVPVGLLLIDSEHKIILANPVGNENLKALANAEVGDKLTHLGNRMLDDLIASPTTEGLRHEVMAKGQVFEVAAQAMSDDLKTSNLLLVINDVTLERQVQRQLSQQERLAAVGQMAAGLAHDFNNIMSIIALYARQDLREMDLPGKLQDHLEIITHQTDRARDLIQQILDFGRRAILERRPVDLAEVVEEQIKLLKRMLPETVRIEFDKSDEAYIVNADKTRMQQILLNLALNSRDAMPDGGMLQIKLSHLHITKKKLAKLPEIEPGDWVCMTVSDEGVGISSDVLPHIFNPFFSTKPPGEGTGLGLPQVYGIVRQHSGYINVETAPGEGASFTIYLPAESEKPQERPVVDKRLSLRGHGETILVVEDNEALLKALVEILASLDYRVLGAFNGREALDILEKHNQEVDLVLSDLVMPEMGGKELMQTMQQRGLRIPTVMMTGHPREDELLDLEADGLCGWLRKPPTIEQIARLLARILEGRSV
jgi:two-component system cell cycle sensor histidine kinase/response regulator CckA